MATETALSLEDRGPPPACPQHFNMAAYVIGAADKTPDKVALEIWDRTPARWRYGDLASAVRGTMTGLAGAGLDPGDRLFLRLGNSADFPVLFLAAIGLGALPVPISPQLTNAEVAALAAQLRPRLAVRSAGLELPSGLRVLEQADFRAFRTLPPRAFADTKAEDPAYIIYTSGTGGQPKAVVHAQRAVFARRMMWSDWCDLRPDDRVLHAGAFNWTYTLGTGLMDPWAIGATALVHAGPPDRAVWSRLAAEAKPTIFAAAPGVYRQLLATGTVTRAAFATLRHGLSAGDRLPDQTRDGWRDATGTELHSALGMSEVSTYISECPAHPGKPRPQAGRKIAILGATDAVPLPRGQTGRLAVAATDPGLMLGYWRENGPDLPLEDGWFITGDQAQMAADGTIAHHGRADDLMNAQGYRVSAMEVEAALLAHPGVTEVAVLPLSPRPGVEIIGAFVVATPDTSVAALHDHCAARLASYKCPRHIQLIDALPRTATGKIRKTDLARTRPTP